MHGIGRRSVERIIAESWTEIVPQCNESAGKKKSTSIRKGNKFLKATILECARASIRHKGSYFYAKYCKIPARRGATEHCMRLHTVWS
ncbi:MAG TPA: hypothetical protein DEF42_02150 [Desulfosporosinus sp.]|nr:hypothetical protein [Desulfosporosinus sp.]